jgi:hypothetical protein
VDRRRVSFREQRAAARQSLALQHLGHRRGELVDVPVRIDVACGLDRGVPEQLLDRLQIARTVEHALAGRMLKKLTRYARDPSHQRGQHKARVFASALGIRADDWRYLCDQILESVRSSPVQATRITPFGVAYEVVVEVEGLNGATAPVVTTWIAHGDEPSRLTSTWVDVP